MVNFGGRVSGSRFPAPHLGKFIGPLPKLGQISKNLIVRAKQPAYATHIHIRQILGPQPPAAPFSHNTLVRADQPAYPTRPRIQPWKGPYAPLRRPIENTFVFPVKQPRYATHPLIQPWKGPYPLLGQISRNLLMRAKQPPYGTHLHIGEPIITPSAPAGPVAGEPFVLRAKQPAYRTHLLIRPWLGPYPTLGAVSRNRLVRTRYAAYPTRRLYNSQWVFEVPQPSPPSTTSMPSLALLGVGMG